MKDPGRSCRRRSAAAFTVNSVVVSEQFRLGERYRVPGERCCNWSPVRAAARRGDPPSFRHEPQRLRCPAALHEEPLHLDGAAIA